MSTNVNCDRKAFDEVWLLSAILRASLLSVASIGAVSGCPFGSGLQVSGKSVLSILAISNHRKKEAAI